MKKTAALLVWFCCSLTVANAQSCDGAGAVQARVKAVTDDAEIILEDDKRLLLNGIEISDLTRKTLLPPLREGLPAGEAILYLASSTPDRWNRYPALVFLPPEGSYGTDWIQETIAAKGFARALPGSLPAPCWSRLLQAESSARKAGEGIWRNPDATVVAATALERLKELDGRRAIIFGKPVSFGQGRATIYLNFGVKRYDAFTLMIAKRRLKSFERAGMTPSALVGRALRVRGVVLAGRQPRIEAYAPEDIELLEEGADGSR